jgi:hypothetical protein
MVVFGCSPCQWQVTKWAHLSQCDPYMYSYHVKHKRVNNMLLVVVFSGHPSFDVTRLVCKLILHTSWNIFYVRFDCHD